jgi:hypothetical protein
MKKTKPKKPQMASAAPGSVMPAAATSPTTVIPTPTPVGTPVPMRTRLRTPAQRSAAELVRFLKVHAKRPYGKRGQRAILDLAQRVMRQAQQESKTFAEVIPMHNRAFVEASLAGLQQGNVTTADKTIPNGAR